MPVQTVPLFLAFAQNAPTHAPQGHHICPVALQGLFCLQLLPSPHRSAAAMIRKMVSCLVPKGRPSASLTPIQGLNSQDEVVDPPKVQLLEEQLEEVTKLTEVQGMEQSHTDATDPTFTSTATFSLDLDSVKPLKNDIEKSTRAILVACQMLHLNGELTEAQVSLCRTGGAPDAVHAQRGDCAVWPKQAPL